MRTHRTLPTIALLVVAVMGLSACVAINEHIAGRDLICEGTPEDVCIRVADLVTSSLPDEITSTMSEMTIEPRACDADEAGDTRCWSIEALMIGGSAGASVHQHADGSLGMHYTSIGSPPDT